MRSSPCSAVSCLQQIAMSRSLPSYAEGLRTEIHLQRTRAARCGHRAPELFNELPGSFKTPLPMVPNIPELRGADRQCDLPRRRWQRRLGMRYCCGFACVCSVTHRLFRDANPEACSTTARSCPVVVLRPRYLAWRFHTLRQFWRFAECVGRDRKLRPIRSVSGRLGSGPGSNRARSMIGGCSPGRISPLYLTSPI